MNMRHIHLPALLMLGLSAFLARADDFRGSISRMPAEIWQDGFVSGNGRMGAVLSGTPGNEVLAVSHCRLYMPSGNREIVPDLAAYLPEIRGMIRAAGDKPWLGAKEAVEFLEERSCEQGHEGFRTDSFHPGMFVEIKQERRGQVRDYERTLNFEKGEIAVQWSDDQGEFRRRIFVSRPDNLIVISLQGPVAPTIEFPELNRVWIDSDQTTESEWVTAHHRYVNGKGGFDVVARVVRRDEGRDTLVLIRVVPWKSPLPPEKSEAWAYSPDHPDFKTPGLFVPAPPTADSSVVAYLNDEDARALMPQLKASVAEITTDYEALLVPHAALHGELFRRVKLDLGGGADRLKPTEELMAEAINEDRLPAALMEKMYDAGRYMFISAAGELAPNLQGIWIGDWRAPWSGDFTLDTNIQSAMASAASANLLDLMEGYFRLMEGFYPEWRLSAKRIYGVRGLLTNLRASNTALVLRGKEYVLWTSGCGWLMRYFIDYADYTGDREFLESRVVPPLREIAYFYEDFLVPGADGKLEFIPSYNPETAAGVNAVMDIAVARDVLSNLIRACRQLDIEQEQVPRWEAMLARLPDYPITRDGVIPEFSGGRLFAGHRHYSQLYGCYQSYDPLFAEPGPLREAARKTVLAKQAAIEQGPQRSGFARIQSGVAAAFLDLPEAAYGQLKALATGRQMYNSLITSHDPDGHIFNVDANGGVPHVANMMLLQCHDGELNLLPTLPGAWPDGAIRGIRARGGFEVDLAWKQGEMISCSIRSWQGRPLRVRYGEVVADHEIAQGERIHLNRALNLIQWRRD